MTKAAILRKIREKCLDCCCGRWKEVELCEIEGCALHILRYGKDPSPSKRGFAKVARPHGRETKQKEKANGNH